MKRTRAIFGISLAVLLVTAGCGGGSSKTTSATTAASETSGATAAPGTSGTTAAPGTSGSTPRSSGGTLKEARVRVNHKHANAAPRSWLARAADLLGWPQVAEASHCTVSGGGQTAPTPPAGSEIYVIPGPITLGPGGTLDVTATCGTATGTIHLSGLTPDTAVSVSVDLTGQKVGGSGICDGEHNQEGEFQCESDG
jgi:hypothetical protein